MTGPAKVGTTMGRKMRPAPVAFQPKVFLVKSGRTESTGDARFKYHQFKFPIRGGHRYGDGIGAPRSGHTHQGQDLFARCGAPLVAARGGRVQWKAYHSSAGYYLVIDGKKTGRDYVYMHLKKPSPLREGQRVRTGEKIGKVAEVRADLQDDIFEAIVVSRATLRPGDVEVIPADRIAEIYERGVVLAPES